MRSVTCLFWLCLAAPPGPMLLDTTQAAQPTPKVARTALTNLQGAVVRGPTDQRRLALLFTGHANAEIARWSAELGLALINLTPGTRAAADYTEDDAKNFVSSQAILESVFDREQADPQGLNGWLLLLHLGAGPRRTDKFHSNFPQLLDRLGARGYACVRVDQLLEPPLPSPPAATPPFIRANQLGYRPADAKIAVAFSKTAIPDSFVVADAENGDEVFRGQTRPLPGEHWGRFPHCAELDFSVWRRPGRYLLRMGEVVSWPFSISDAVFGAPSALSPEGASSLANLRIEGLRLHPAPEQLYHQVADDRDHTGFRLPRNDRADYGWGPGSNRVVYAADGRPQGLRQFQSQSTGLANLAGRYAAAMALAYQVWQDDPPHRPWAERCLQAGCEVYELGRRLEGVQQGNSFHAPYRYEETTWADDMEWGAAELFRATRQPRYLEDAQRYARLAAAESWMGQDQTGHYQFYPFLNLGHFRLHDLADDELKQRLADYYAQGIERCLRASRDNPCRAGAPFIWCSNNLLVALATQCLLYERMTGNPRYRPFAARQRDWLLGTNPWGHTMFTEIGRVFPTDVHLITTKLTGRRVRGGLVDGPVSERMFKSLRGVSITEPDPLVDCQDARAVYHNDIKDYATNEPTMDGTASAILLWVLWN